MDREDNTELKEKIDNTIKNLLDSVTRWERIKWGISMSVSEWLWKYLPMKELRRKWYMFIIRLYGFRPLKCVDYMYEYTFIFKTQDEADRAFYRLENRGDNKRILVTGWWYGEKEFEEEQAVNTTKNRRSTGLVKELEEATAYFSNKTLLLAYNSEKIDWWLFEETPSRMHELIMSLSRTPSTKYTAVTYIAGQLLADVLKSIMDKGLTTKTVATDLLKELLDIPQN